MHRERANYQAILVGSNTAIVDNPSLLTTISTDYPPIRIVIDRRGRLLQHRNLKLLTDGQAPTWIFTRNAELQNSLTNEQVKVWLMKTDQLSEIIQTLTEEGIQSVYVEGGPILANAFMNDELMN